MWKLKNTLKDYYKKCENFKIKLISTTIFIIN